MPNDFNIGEDWTDSTKDFSTTGTLESGSQTVTGDVDASGTVTGATVNQGVNNVLDDSDLITNGGDVVEVSDIINAGPSAPSSPFAGMLWFDSANHLLKVRNEANSAWLSIWDLANNKPVITNLTDEILGTMLADAVAGDGLSKDGSENLKVNVDDTTIELSGDALQIVSDNSEVTNVRVSANDTTPGILNGKLVAGDNITLTEGSDGGDETLTVDTKFRGALVTLAADYELAEAVTVYDLSFTVETYDTDGFHESVTYPYRLTVPAGVSRIRLSAQVAWEAKAAENQRCMRVVKNDTTIVALCLVSESTDVTLGGVVQQLVTPVLSVVEGDYFELAVNMSGTPPVDVLYSTLGGTWFSIEVVE